MQWLIFLTLLHSFLCSSQTALTDCSYCNSALVLVNTCRSQDTSYFDFEEDYLHSLAYALLVQHFTPSIPMQYIMPVVEREYVEHLQRVRKELLGREGMGKVVERASKGNAWGYLPMASQVNVFKHAPVKGILRFIKRPYEYYASDALQREYYLSAMSALRTFASAQQDYHGYSRFPSFGTKISVENCLEQMSKFIGRELVTFDYGATYPDAIMCFSILQYLQYMALLEYRMRLVMIVHQLYRVAANVLINICVKPVQSWTFNLPNGNVSVCIMPQGRKGPKPIPECTSLGAWPVVKVGVKDIKNPSDSVEVYEQLKHLDAIVRAAI